MSAEKEEILELKKQKNAIILAHYYQNLDVQDIADMTGDSYALAEYASKADADIIILCGVRFMAESAKILNPEKKVYLPASDAGCPMADMVTREDVLRLREEYPDAAVLCYVNSSAEVKAVSDVCCTSSSAVKIARAIPEKRIVFVPDQNLGEYVQQQVPEKEIILFDGFCPTHHRHRGEDARAARLAHPDAEFLIHPECRPEVLAFADYIGSTAGILERARESESGELVIGTESTIVEMLKRDMPNRKIYTLSDSFVCPNMKKTAPHDIMKCLRGEIEPLELSADELSGARASLVRMINI